MEACDLVNCIVFQSLSDARLPCQYSWYLRPGFGIIPVFDKLLAQLF